MIGIDTNVLARYYIEDDTDDEAASQRDAARALIESGAQVSVALTVILELEWVMRGYYGFERDEIGQVYRHLLSLPNVRIQGRDLFARALDHYTAGLDFADSLHHASYRDCEYMASFDDRKFARRAHRLGLAPPVRVLR